MLQVDIELFEIMPKLQILPDKGEIAFNIIGNYLMRFL